MESAMNSTKRICASLVLLFGFLLTTALIKVYRANAANSFAAAQQDSPPSPVTYFDSKKLAETFTKGGVLSDWTGDNKNYRVSIYRIEKAPYTEYLGFEI